MKKYFSGLLALIIAIGATAFTNANKNVLPEGTKLFRYVPPALSPFSEANVENRANWVLVTGSAICEGVNQKACELIVDDVHINPNNTLKSTLTIDALQFGQTGVFYVNQSSAAEIINKTN
jgi:hypothetical protein